MPVNGISAEELMDCWEAAGCGYDAAVLGRLWASVPPEMRLPACRLTRFLTATGAALPRAAGHVKWSMSVLFPARCARR